jgi:predicted nucleic acid-binding protein
LRWNVESFTGDRLYLDTNIIVVAIEQGNPWMEQLKELFQAIDERRIHAFTSELTLAEAIAKPFAVGAADLILTYETLLAPESAITVVPIDRAILRTAAELQGRLGVKLADAIHLATALQSTCDFVVTNDERLGRKMPLQVRWLSLADMFAPSSER